MPKKQTKPKNQIHALESSIKDAEKKLAKAYTQSITQLKKQLMALNKKTLQARKHIITAKAKLAKANTAFKASRKPANKQQVAKAKTALASSRTKLVLFNAEQKVVKIQLQQTLISQKKYIQREKALAQFEKNWTKSATKKRKVTKRRPSAVASGRAQAPRARAASRRMAMA